MEPAHIQNANLWNTRKYFVIANSSYMSNVNTRTDTQHSHALTVIISNILVFEARQVR